MCDRAARPDHSWHAAHPPPDSSGGPPARPRTDCTECQGRGDELVRRYRLARLRLAGREAAASAARLHPPGAQRLKPPVARPRTEPSPPLVRGRARGGEGMAESAGSLGRRVLAWAIIIAVAVIALKLAFGIVFGLVSALISIALLVVVVMGVLWALRHI